jgi:hypothetical protein
MQFSKTELVELVSFLFILKEVISTAVTKSISRYENPATTMIISANYVISTTTDYDRHIFSAVHVLLCNCKYSGEQTATNGKLSCPIHTLLTLIYDYTKILSIQEDSKINCIQGIGALLLSECKRL